MLSVFANLKSCLFAEIFLKLQEKETKQQKHA